MSSYFKDVFKLEAERDFESAFSSCMVNRITANAERSVLTVYVEPDGELPRDMLLRASELIREQVLFSKEIRVSLVDTKAEREREAERREALEAAQKKPEPEKRQALPGQNGFRRSQNQWTPKQDKKSDNPDVIFGYDFTGEPIALSAVTDGMGEAVVQGRIFSPESIKTRNGKFILRFNLTDDTDSIACRMFLDENEFSEVEDKMKAGTWVVLNGSVMPPDNFNPDISFGKIRGVRKGKDRRGQRMDQYDGRRRIELSLHTKMSDRDGLGDFSEYAKLAAKWGWSGLAVTDSDSVQQFPTAAHTMEKYPEMKLLFGIQATLVDDAKNAVLKSRGQSLDGEFVVFDIETTGFSQTKCRIIEIGAVKVREGQITERFSQFIDPEMPIPPHITKLTTITDAEVRGQGNYEKWIPEFVKFCGDAPVVGHNAQFDVGFIRHYAALCGIEFDPTVVDTLGLSHLLLKQLFRNRLDNVAKELHVVLSTHHRAVYDAEATAGIFLSFCEMLKNKGITDLDALYEADVMDETTVKKLHGSHFDILVKNDFGRTNLYRLVSAAHIDYFHETPRMPKSVAAKLRDGLLFGSGDEKSDLYDALIRGLDDREVEEIASFFDYLEVIPPSNLEYLLDDESASLDTIDDIRAMNRRIIEIGEKLGKPVVAVGNVHFAEPQDAVFRKVLKYFEYANKGRASRFSEKEFMSPLYLKTTEEMLAEFPDLDEETRRKIVIDNTLLLADMGERISPVRPDKCPPVIENSDKELRDICYNKAHEMYGPDLPDEVSVRLEKELTSIISNGYSVMYIMTPRLVWGSN